MENVKTTGLKERMEQKAEMDIPVSARDILELIKVVNHNAETLTNNVKRIDERLDKINKAQVATAEVLANQIEINQTLKSINDRVETDLKGIYKDLNLLAQVTNVPDGKFVRQTEIDDVAEIAGQLILNTILNNPSGTITGTINLLGAGTKS